MMPRVTRSWTDFRVVLACAPPAVQKQLIGEKLYPLVVSEHPSLGGKLTGLLLRKANDTLLAILEDETRSLLRQHVAETLARHLAGNYERGGTWYENSSNPPDEVAPPCVIISVNCSINDSDLITLRGINMAGQEMAAISVEPWRKMLEVRRELVKELAITCGLTKMAKIELVDQDGRWDPPFKFAGEMFSEVILPKSRITERIAALLEVTSKQGALQVLSTLETWQTQGVCRMLSPRR